VLSALSPGPFDTTPEKDKENDSPSSARVRLPFDPLVITATEIPRRGDSSAVQPETPGGRSVKALPAVPVFLDTSAAANKLSSDEN